MSKNDTVLKWLNHNISIILLVSTLLSRRRNAVGLSPVIADCLIRTHCPRSISQWCEEKPQILLPTYRVCISLLLRVDWFTMLLKFATKSIRKLDLFITVMRVFLQLLKYLKLIIIRNVIYMPQFSNTFTFDFKSTTLPLFSIFLACYIIRILYLTLNTFKMI